MLSFLKGKLDERSKFPLFPQTPKFGSEEAANSLQPQTPKFGSEEARRSKTAQTPKFGPGEVHRAQRSAKRLPKFDFAVTE